MLHQKGTLKLVTEIAGRANGPKMQESLSPPQRPRRRRPRAALQEGTARALSRRGEPQVSAAGRGGRGAHAASTSPRGRVTRSQGR